MMFKVCVCIQWFWWMLTTHYKLSVLQEYIPFLLHDVRLLTSCFDWEGE